MKYLKVALIFVSLFLLVGCVSNRLNSRVFSLKPALYLSSTIVDRSDLTNVSFEKVEIVDNRLSVEKDFENSKNEVVDFWKSSVSNSIYAKIAVDLGSDNVSLHSSPNVLKIEVKTFYANVSGFIWETIKAVVWIKVTVQKNDQGIFEKEYREIYNTDGTDRDYEGSLVDTIEGGANVAVGMTLRRSLDHFYQEYLNILKQE